MPEDPNDEIVECECGLRIPRSEMKRHKKYCGVPLEVPDSGCSDAGDEPWMTDFLGIGGGLGIGQVSANVRLARRLCE